MSGWDPRDKANWVRSGLMLFGAWCIALVFAAWPAISETYHYPVESTGVALPDGGPDNAIVRADGVAGAVQVSLPTIDDSGNITMPAGATVDGYEISTIGAKVDGLPAQAVSQSQVSPGDASIVSGVYSGQGYGSTADAAVRVAACTVQLPLNSTCKLRVLWAGKQVADAGTGLTPIASGDMERAYHVRTGASAIAAVTVTTAVADNNSLTGTYASNTTDGAVLEPVAVGNGQPIWWTCYVMEIFCNAI